MSDIARHHSEWLSMIEVSGPFLTLPVLVRVFPQGLPKVDGKKLGRLRAAYEEWANAQDAKAPDASALHATWVQLVLGELLEFDDQTLRSGDGLPSGLDVPLAEHHETLRPSIAIVEPSGRTKAGMPRLLVAVWPSNQDLESAVPAARWAASPLERMTLLCRSAGVRLGLVTNGERWTVVDAPVGQTAGLASWYAGLWLQEPITLGAFEAMLGVRRFFAVADTDTIEALLDESVAFQQEVTDQLGYQVRRAVEVLVQALDRADLDRKRELLRDVPPARLYDAALTVMMRLVFLFCAEERGLLLLGDETYDANYAVSTLRALLREEADRVGVEVLERRQDAWARLLATFRAVHGGVEHEALRLPALGGSLFDPDRFPFLEGRAAGTSWLATPASPLPIDNRTVLHLLEALQLLRTRGDGGTSEARKLSYRALDIEQIGHVYEGLLDHVAIRVDTDTLGFLGTKDKEPELSLDELNRERRHGTDGLIGFLKEHTGRSTSALRNDLDAELDDVAEQRLLVACGNDMALVKHIAPYHALIRKDVWGYPQIYRAGSFMVTGGSERRQTGTHYTPKSLTEQIVTETLEPLVYVGPAEGKPRDAWKLRSAVELLDLKICDMAMGSGAFLVQVCRWLAERVAEAWEEAERQRASISAHGEVLEKAAGRDLLSPDREERLSLARRMVAERCIYGVDINPMAIELAKLSLWLVTLSKGRPFGFLDHNLRCGDSLLGISRLEQLTELSMSPKEQAQGRLFGKSVRQAVEKAVAIRRQLRDMPIHDIRDVEVMASLDATARETVRLSERLADEFIAVVLTTENERALESRLAGFSVRADQIVNGGDEHRLLATVANDLAPFHWPLEFPEVFSSARKGFDAVVSNPPWGARLTDELQHLWKSTDGDKLGRLVDSFHLFILRAGHLMASDYSTCGTQNALSGLVVPDVLLYQGYSQPLREHLLRHHRLISVCNLGEGVFLNVVRPCCFMVFAANRAPSAPYELTIGKWATGHAKAQSLSSAAIVSFPGCVVPIADVGEYREVASLALKAGCRLSDLVNDLGIQRGVSADNKDVFVVEKSLAREEQLENEVLRPVVTGGVHVRPFEISDDLPLLIYTDRTTKAASVPNVVKWVRQNASKITCKEVKDGKHEIHVLHRARERRLFEQTSKLIGVITADRPKVAVDHERRYAMDGVYVLAPRHDIDPYFLAGVLNSDLMARIYRVFSQEEGRVMAQVKPTVLAELPMVSPDQELELSQRVASLAKRLHGRLSSESRSALTGELNALVEDLFAAAMKRGGVEVPEGEPANANAQTVAAAKKASTRRTSR